MSQEVKTVVVKKSSCDHYLVLVDGGRSWAAVTLFPFGEKGGGLAILSDWGNWAHGWPAPGEQGFKRFILEMDRSRDYLLRKLTYGRPLHFDAEATVQKVKRWIEEDAHNLDRTGPGEEYWDVDTVEDAHGDLDDVATSWGNDPGLFVRECLDRKTLRHVVNRRLYDGVAVMVPDPACRGFLESLWPHFVAEIRRELAGQDATRKGG